MKKINFIFLRSSVTNSTKLKDKEKDKFLKKLNKKNDFDFCKSGDDFFFIETGGTEEIFKSIFCKYKQPYRLVATNANNSLPAALEIVTFLKNNHLEFELYHGTPKEIRKSLLSRKNSIKSTQNYEINKNKILKNQRFGVIGKPSDWLIASEVKNKQAEVKLGAKIVNIDIKELIQNYKKESSNFSTQKYKKLLNKKVDLVTLKNALKIYKAIKKIIKKYKLNGFTIRCFDLLGKIKNTSCLALAILNQEGIIGTCEGDIPAMLTMAIIKKVFNQSSFQINPSYINLEKQYAYLAHCTLPLDMCKNYKLDSHFESGIGVGIKGELFEDDVTIFKLNKNLNNYAVYKGKIIKNLNRKNLCRTQIKVRFEQDIFNLLNSPNGNHLLIFYGDHKDKLISLLSIKN